MWEYRKELSLTTLQEVNNSETENTEARRYFQTECRKSAEEIVGFMTSLRKDNFVEFWLPCRLKHFLRSLLFLFVLILFNR